MTVDLPSGWTRTPLASLGLWGSGGTPSRQNPEAFGEGIPWLKIGDLSDGPVRGFEESITAKGLANSSAKLLEPGTLLVAMYGSIGKLGITTFRCATNQAIAFCKLHEGIDLRYAFYALLNERQRLLDLGQGGTQLNISQTLLRAHEVSLAPAREQQRIVSRIEELFSEIDEGERALERVGRLVERYRQSVLKAAVTGELTQGEAAAISGHDRVESILHARHELWRANESSGRYPEPMGLSIQHDLPTLPHGWTWACIDQIGMVSGGLTKNRGRAEHAIRRPYLRVANVYANRLNLDEIQEIGVSEAELPRVTLKPADLLVVEGNGSVDQIGRVALWDGSIPDCVHQNHIIKVRCTDLLPSWYVLVWCLSPLGRAHIERVASSSSGLHTLSISKIQSLPIPVPPIEALKRIKDEFDRMDAAMASVRASLTAESVRSTALRQSILKAAFSGQLVPQDPNDEPAAALLARIASQAAETPNTPKRRGRPASRHASTA